MGNDELNTLDYFFCFPNHRALLGHCSPNGANAPNTLKQAKLDFQMAFGFE